MDLIQRAKAYLIAIENGLAGDGLNEWYAEDAEQIEFPNLYNPKGAIRNLAELKSASKAGAKLMKQQAFTLKHAHLSGSTVILELEWAATLAIAAGPIPAGGQMKAHFAQFIEFRKGKIYRQRTYDCFEV
jgi:ketosteroid isomerase-like protein